MLKINHNYELPNQPKNKKLKKLIVSAGQYLILFGFMILLAGHENTNPHLGESQIDFYASKSLELIRIQSNTFFNKSSIDSIADIALLVNYLVADLYRARDYQPIWTINYTTTPPFQSLLNILDSSAYYGFPEDYFNLSLLKKFNETVEEISSENEDLDKRIELEMQASRSAILLLIFLNQGINANNTNPNYINYLKSLPAILNSSLEKDNIKEAVLHVQPPMVAYNNLKSSVPGLLETIAEVKSNNQSIINDSSLAKALYFAGTINNSGFDSIDTKESVIQTFQKNYKLPITGQLNDTTIQKLLSVLQYRYFQVCLNFNRLRKINNSSPNYLFVNIPEFKLHVIENNELKDQYNVIVGKTNSPTPTLSSNIEQIVANPYWTVPRSIANNEMLYKIRKDSNYLKRNGYFVIDNKEELVEMESIDWKESDPLGKQFWIRQKNIRGNALGQVKFLFPNKYHVYLHDTQGKQLFKKEKRAFSHGCVRLQNPERLAQYMTNKLYSNQSDTINIKSVIRSNKRRVFQLDATIAIHIQYITSMGDENGLLRFYNDIYKRDSRDINELFPVDFAM